MNEILYNQLVEKLIKCSNAYYKENKSLITDKEFDILMKELEKVEFEHPEWAREDSPIKRVGSDVIDKTKLSKHDRPMLSLENTYSPEEVEEWYRKMKEANAKEYIVEPKYDGCSFAAKYVNGKLVLALSRGDGEYGEDLTSNLKNSIDSGLTNISKDFTGEVRGEIIMTRTEFNRINSESKIKYANPRNLVSGTLKLLDVKEFQKRKLTAYTYWLEDHPEMTQEESLLYMRQMGFKVGQYFKCRNFEEIKCAINEIEHLKQEAFDFDADGAVIKVNQKSIWNVTGSTAKFPRWAKAYKYDPEQALTKVLNIEFWVGRTGKITPVAILEPVFLSGSTVSKATLNNKEYIEKLDIRVGDTVAIKKAAEIIPFIIRVIKEDRHGEEQPIIFPTICPVCGSQLSKENEEQADYYCKNLTCPARIVNNICNYTHIMKIDGFAEILVERLHENGILNSISDLYRLKDKKDILCQMDRLGEKIVLHLLSEIEQSKKQSFTKFVAAIGIKGVGERTAKTITKKFKNIEDLENATISSLTELEDIGEIIATNIYSFFRIQENSEMINFMKSIGMNLSINEGTKIENNLFGKTFCITGTLSMPRNKIIELIESKGGKVVSDVSSKTNYLITNDTESGSSKNQKAKLLEIPIINEETLNEMLK